MMDRSGRASLAREMGVLGLTAPATAWYFRSTWLWAAVMAAGSIIYAREVASLTAAGVDLRARFAALPPE
jgi:hypothetical protein